MLPLLFALGIPAASFAQTEASYLKAGDEVLVRVWPDTTLSGRYRVEADGSAYMPMLGPVSVTSRTIESVRAELIERYAEIMVSPVVVVVPRFRVSILGGVRSPGLYYVEAPTTLMDVVSLAGGFVQNAKADEIRLLRGERVYGVDAETALLQGGSTAAVPLESGDRIVVPTSSGRSTLQIVQVLVSLGTLVTLIVGR